MPPGLARHDKRHCHVRQVRCSLCLTRCSEFMYPTTAGRASGVGGVGLSFNTWTIIHAIFPSHRILCEHRPALFLGLAGLEVQHTSHGSEGSHASSQTQHTRRSSTPWPPSHLACSACPVPAWPASPGRRNTIPGHQACRWPCVDDAVRLCVLHGAAAGRGPIIPF